ncbi:hypothetical protein BGW38_002000 [Lunasporangiospora selenospora]|uniref:Uncharacterized protein n=1 Tax=Lunasporangiospora selenospora TaxID=979761 RepID=A0A9P6FTE4_9FUNG|nr:hypothetical protein BGW38_002000 [Lunasporangiospora selenospora]
MDQDLDSFDQLCRGVFLSNSDGINDVSIDETALSLLSRAQIYELSSSFISASSTQSINDSLENRTCYRIHLESLDDPTHYQGVYDTLVRAIDPAVLMQLPFDRNLSGYSSASRAGTVDTSLGADVVLDMTGLDSTTPISATPANNAHLESRLPSTMLLVPTKEWLRLTGRIRFWRAESHRIKAAEREEMLDRLLSERWSSFTMPPSSSVLRTRMSPLKLVSQEQQLAVLVQFMTEYGESEPSVSSILRGLLDLIRRQLTEARILTWTFDRANLTEQRPEVTIAFLDLMAKLGLETVDGAENFSAHGHNSGSSMSSTIPASTLGPITTLTVATKDENEKLSTDMTWTLGISMDDRRLQSWIHSLQQSTLPSLKVDDHALLPTTATIKPDGDNGHLGKIQGSNTFTRNPIPTPVRKRFLQDRNTIAAGTAQVWMAGSSSDNDNANTDSNNSYTMIRDGSLVLASSPYALSLTGSGPKSGSLGVTLFVDRVRTDVKCFARWATTCGGRLDWIWMWLFSSLARR